MHSAERAGIFESGARKKNPGRLQQLFNAAQERTSVDHETLLRSMDATPQERQAVGALLRAQDKRSVVLDTPVLDWVRQFENCAYSEKAIYGREIGNFTLEEVIGRGGSADVYRAREVRGERRVAAVKLIHKGVYSPNGRRRFQREAQILAQLQHPNIAALLDFGITAWGMPYLALEHIEGTDIIAYANLHALNPRERVAMLVRVCNGLNAAHAQRIVHRDIKPGNILVTVDGDVKVVDFGIGKLHNEDDATATIEVALTPSYAAPEQYEGGVARPSADVYALGVLASELLLGVRLGPDCAWPKGPIADVVRERWRRMPRALKRVVSTALKSTPAHRYQSAGELADVLDAALVNRARPMPRASSRSVVDLIAGLRRSLSAYLLPTATFILGALVCALWMSRYELNASAAARHYDMHGSQNDVSMHEQNENGRG
ncbi:MAG: serine/threonine-protein kinase [Rudaea sp.]